MFTFFFLTIIRAATVDWLGYTAYGTVFAPRLWGCIDKIYELRAPSSAAAESEKRDAEPPPAHDRN